MSIHRKGKCKSLSWVWLFATPRTIQSREFFRPEYWSRQPFPSPGDLPNPGTEPRSPTLQARNGIKKLQYLYTTEYHSAIKKEHNWVICRDVDGPRDCHTEWSKSEREKQISYINAQTWNLEKWYGWSFAVLSGMRWYLTVALIFRCWILF